MTQPPGNPTRPFNPGMPPAQTTQGNKRQGVAPARSSSTPEARERRPMTTSRVLALWRLVVVLSCLAVAVIGPLVLNENRASLERVNAAAQQVLLLKSVRGDLLAAEASGTHALLITAPGQEPDRQFAEDLATASEKFTRAATLSPPDAESMAPVGASLTRYAAELSRAMATGSTTAMGQASDFLQGDLLVQLDVLISDNLVWLEVSTADQRWLSALVAMPIVLILIASVVAARRTRRVLNLGLVIALAISVSILVLVTQLVTTSAQSVSVVQTSGVTEATSVAGAYAAVTEAKAIEGRVLLGVTPAQAGGAAYSAAVDAAGQALAQLPAAQASGMVDQLGAMVNTHDQLMAAPTAQLPELLTAAQQPYEALVEWLAQQSSQIGSNLDQQLTDHAKTVQNAIGLVAAGMVAAALAAGIGLSQPLRRYQ